MQCESLYYSVNDIEVHAEIHGASVSSDQKIQTEKNILIAVPGGPGFSHTIFKPALNPVAAEFPLVYFDPRGTGRSSLSSPEHWNVNQLADDLAALIEKLGAKNVFLYAHSGGTCVAASLISRFPYLVKGLVCSNGTLADKDTMFKNWIAFGGDIAKRMMIKLDVNAVPEFMAEVLPKYDPITRPIEHSETLELNLEQCMFMIHSFLEQDNLKLLRDYEGVCHFILGKQDPLCRADQSRQLLEKLNKKNVSWSEFEGSGHDNLLCEPEKTIQEVLNLLSMN